MRHFQSTRLGTDICAGKKIPSALTSSGIKMRLSRPNLYLIAHNHLQRHVTSYPPCADCVARLVHRQQRAATSMPQSRT